MRWTRLILGAAALGAAAAAGAVLLVLSWQEPGRPFADPDDPAKVALGQRLYVEHCADCHGARLEGQPDWQRRKPDGRLPAPPHDETGHTWHHSDAVLLKITRDGPAAILPGYESDMPAYAGILSDDDILAVLAYIKSRWPGEILERQAAIAGDAR